MTEEFKKWLCKLIEEEQQFDGYYQDPDCVDSLVKAMWAINREGKYVIRQYRTLFNIWISGNPKEIFYFKNNNNSEQETLIKALEYVYDSIVKETDELN